ncbi:hypothetical protein [Rhizobium sp. GN54]|uniref:hypothetical protein n=1 Tax=Rhizobium sp. GN54 TaxID=2898150 RepID=UPI001E597E1B|nr:hypothetical protein [Rhizobium sp. GN54]MCD2183502.1 hypothetical protein [Rhizobium sp. GN54]
MSEKDRLLKTLFETADQSHLNIKFFRGFSDEISTEDLCREANSAFFQFESGIAVTSTEFGDADRTSFNVKEMFA